MCSQQSTIPDSICIDFVPYQDYTYLLNRLLSLMFRTTQCAQCNARCKLVTVRIPLRIILLFNIKLLLHSVINSIHSTPYTDSEKSEVASTLKRFSLYTHVRKLSMQTMFILAQFTITDLVLSCDSKILYLIQTPIHAVS